MASRILEDEFETGGDYKITVKFTNYRDYKRTCDFINGLNRECTTETVNPAPQKLEKPKGMLYILNDSSMLELAKQVINAVEFSVDTPTGLAAINFNKDSKVSDKLKELIEYLRTNAEWRE